MPFGITNSKSQIAKYEIWYLRFEIPSASEQWPIAIALEGLHLDRCFTANNPG